MSMHVRATRRFRRFATLGFVVGLGAVAPSTAFAADTAAPTAPTKLVAKPDSNRVSLAWSPSTDNIAVKGYNVWRRLASATAGTGWSPIAKATTVSFSDTTVKNGTGYVYGVRAFDAVGNVSGSSNSVTTTAGALVTAPDPTPTSTPVTTWDPAIPTGAAFDGSMESVLTNNFQLVTELGASPAERVSGTVRRGTNAASMTVRPGQKRSELQPNVAGRTLRVMPGTTAWFADSIYLTPGFPTTVSAGNGFQTVLQWKDAGGTKSSSPPVALNIKNGGFNLHGGYGCPSGPKEFRVPLVAAVPGTWSDFEFQIHFATAGQGWIESYVNGKQVGSRYFPSCGTIYPSPYAEFSILRVGYYRDPSISTAGTIIHDEYRMGTTRSNVSLYR